MSTAGTGIIASRGASRIAAVALLLASTLAPAQDPLKENSEQLERLRARIQTLRQTLERDRSQKDELRSQLEASEQRMAQLTGELKDLRRQIATLAAQRRKTEAERAQAQAQLLRQRQVLAQQIRAAYIIGQRGQTKLVLNQDRSQRLTRVMTYYDYLNRARAQRIGSIQAQVEVLAGLALKLRQQTAELEAARNRQLGALTALEAARAERQEMIETLAARIAGGEGELKQLRADERQLTRLLEELRSVLADVPAHLGSRPFARLKGRLSWPLHGKLLARYGQPKASGLKWNGLWIAAIEGEPVKAVARGRVAYVGWMHRYGLIVVLEHEGGYYSLYGHNQSVSVTVGDWAQTGDVIARAGASGGHERSGLYFELRKGTEAINPQPWFRGKS